MEPVIERPAIPLSYAPTLLAATFQQYGYRLNNVAPLDGSEPFTGEVTFEAGLTVSGGTVTLPNNSIADGALSSNVALYDGNMNQFSSGTLLDARLSSNVALLDRDPQTFTGANTFQSFVTQFLGTTSVRTQYRVENGGTGEKLWDWAAVAGTSSFRLRTRTDADGGGATAIEVFRSGTTLSHVLLVNNTTGGGLERALTTSDLSSSARFKQNIQDSELDGIAIVKLLKPRTYEWAPEFTQRQALEGQRLGFIAEEVVNLLPEAGVYEPAYEGSLKELHRLDHAAIIAVLVRAVQELLDHPALRNHYKD